MQHDPTPTASAGPRVSDAPLTREQVGLAFSELDMYLKELTSHAANKKRHPSLLISEIARKSHFATLDALAAANARIAVLEAAMRAIVDDYLNSIIDQTADADESRHAMYEFARAALATATQDGPGAAHE